MTDLEVMKLIRANNLAIVMKTVNEMYMRDKEIENYADMLVMLTNSFITKDMRRKSSYKNLLNRISKNFDMKEILITDFTAAMIIQLCAVWFRNYTFLFDDVRWRVFAITHNIKEDVIEKIEIQCEQHFNVDSETKFNLMLEIEKRLKCTV